MVVRRLRRHAARQDWFAVAIDLAILIVGVFLGTQANNWNMARLAANDAAEHRDRLFEDVTANQIDLAARHDYYADVRRHALAALAVLEEPTSVPAESFVVDLYQASQINSRTLRRSTYDELVSAGTLSQFGERPLRDLAETYYRGLAVLDDSVGQLPPYRDRIRRELPYPVIAKIRERCGDLVSERDGVVIFRLPSECRLDFPPATVAAAIARVRGAPGLDRDLSRYIVDLDTRLSNIEGSDRRAVRFKEALKAARGNA